MHMSLKPASLLMAVTDAMTWRVKLEETTTAVRRGPHRTEGIDSS